MILTLTRDTPRLDCQEGILNLNGAQYFTMERPWLDDQPGLSCVSVGTYTLVPHTVKHGALVGLETYALSNPGLGVFPEPPAGYAGSNPMRIACLIHPANWAFQLEGCIAPGKARGLLTPPNSKSPEPAVLASKDAFNEILEALGGPGQLGHTLVIQ